MAQRRRVTGRAALGLVAVVGVLAGAYFVPLPSIGQARDWSDALGPWFVAAFFVVYAVVTIGPIPRSTFTVMSGVLFGPVVGFIGSLAAATVAAVVAFHLARRLGRERVRPLLSKPVVETVEFRLQRRGWFAVGSLRLIPAVPFSLVNYLSGLSSIRPVPYLAATVLGSAPGTAAVVFLGDALTGETNPMMLVLSGCLFAVGVIGLIVDSRLPV
ncbi:MULTISPECIES: TVP38/TMEM64 family protein [unclassified Gordonia (in: high G+C Gram-positive bacteria)]|uniref:TVP38/TMEM64 family protein n=1 Tax=unclassified Gordonia (in: high G+C Gram-positive bacteria) TaxID=2657482 RepID=UPI001F0609FE|nr:TVP38/TMEM64 family protein [Gordonia sp. PDNC005]